MDVPSRRHVPLNRCRRDGGLAVACADRTVGVPLLSRMAGSLTLDPQACGIEHIVVLMMENRSFRPRSGMATRCRWAASGAQLSRSWRHEPRHVPAGADFQGCGHQDPDHSYAGGRMQYNAGACDGWLRVNDTFSIGYYRQEDLSFLGRAVRSGHRSTAISARSLARPFRIGSTKCRSDRPAEQHPGPVDPADHLGSAGRARPSRPLLLRRCAVPRALGAKYVPISRPLDEFFADCGAGSLPHVAFVDGPFLTEGDRDGAGRSSFSDIRAGEAFMNRITRP